MLSPRTAATATSPLAGPPPVDLEAVKARQQAVWASGDFAVIGSTLQIVGETLCEAAEVAAGERVLDVACGNGNAALAAARRFARVTGVDFVPALLDKARGRAAASGLALDLREADAEALPFPDGAFDAVLSTFGVQFTPDPARAARELLRVCRPGGRVALAAWTPDGFIGRIFRAVGAHAPPPPGVPSPALWGTEARLHELLGAGAARLRTAVRSFTFRYRSAAHWLEIFRTWYGPIHRAFQGLPPAGQAALERDLLALLEEGNGARDGSLAVPADYLEAVIVRA
jgi:ubiquinone/menaquinone biosynthesis C-methylase UbiE